MHKDSNVNYNHCIDESRKKSHTQDNFRPRHARHHNTKTISHPLQSMNSADFALPNDAGPTTYASGSIRRNEISGQDSGSEKESNGCKQQ